MEYFIKRIKETLNLCTYDIEIGDICLCDVLGNGVLNEFEFKSIENMPDVGPIWTFEGPGIFIFYPEVEDEDHPFLAITEVSDGIGINGGDTFKDLEEFYKRLYER